MGKGRDLTQLKSEEALPTAIFLRVHLGKNRPRTDRGCEFMRFLRRALFFEKKDIPPTRRAAAKSRVHQARMPLLPCPFRVSVSNQSGRQETLPRDRGGAPKGIALSENAPLEASPGE